jgi:hypothetical protein
VFAPRTLTHFTSTDLGIAPGPLQRTGRRMELVDWDGDGLPDLLDIASGGSARLWPNLGDCTWGRPRALAPLPLFATADAGIGFIDMNGCGHHRDRHGVTFGCLCCLSAGSLAPYVARTYRPPEGQIWEFRNAPAREERARLDGAYSR